MPAIVNICFHGIGRPARVTEPGEDRYWVSHDLFREVLDEVAGRREVRLSFDDGNASDIEVALPALLERDLTATFFPLAGRVGSAGSLDADDIRELARHGMQVGSHGMTHRPWRGMGDSDLRAELVVARDIISGAAGTPVDQAALPLGRYDRRVLSSLRRQGYARVHTSDRRLADPDSWMHPRFSVRHADTPESLRADVLTPAGWRRRVRDEVVGVIKRFR